MKKSLLFFLLLCGIHSMATAAGTRINTSPDTIVLSCPSQIQVEQRLKTLPEGWENTPVITPVLPQTLPHSYPLSSVHFYAGPPQENLELAPTSSKKRQDMLIGIWDLEPEKNHNWLNCAYSSTSVTISKKLPDGPMRCEIRYKNGNDVPARISCTAKNTGPVKTSFWR